MKRRTQDSLRNLFETFWVIVDGVRIGEHKPIEIKHANEGNLRTSVDTYWGRHTVGFVPFTTESCFSSKPPIKKISFVAF